jgi:hypothetical protein
MSSMTLQGRWLIQEFTNAGAAAIVKLAGVQVPPLDKSPGQGRAREFSVRNSQAFTHCRHAVTCGSRNANAWSRASMSAWLLYT